MATVPRQTHQQPFRILPQSISRLPENFASNNVTDNKVYHDVEIKDFKIGDEVEWLSGDDHKLNTGIIHRIVYYVTPSNKEYLLAFVYFYESVPDSVEVVWPDGDRYYRLLVEVKDLKLLEKNDDNVTKPPSKDIHLNPLTQMVLRPCLLNPKTLACHPVVSEGMLIFNLHNQRFVRGAVKALFTCSGTFYIGAAFEMEVYTGELEHSISCTNENSACNKRVAINLGNLSQRAWNSEFKIMLNATEKVSFEELFLKNDPPPSYSLTDPDFTRSDASNNTQSQSLPPVLNLPKIITPPVINIQNNAIEPTPPSNFQTNTNMVIQSQAQPISIFYPNPDVSLANSMIQSDADDKPKDSSSLPSTSKITSIFKGIKSKLKKKKPSSNAETLDNKNTHQTTSDANQYSQPQKNATVGRNNSMNYNSDITPTSSHYSKTWTSRRNPFNNSENAASLNNRYVVNHIALPVNTDKNKQLPNDISITPSPIPANSSENKQIVIPSNITTVASRKRSPKPRAPQPPKQAPTPMPVEIVSTLNAPPPPPMPVVLNNVPSSSLPLKVTNNPRNGENRSLLLEQIRQGIKLKAVDDENNNGGVRSRLSVSNLELAIKNRRSMLEFSDEEESESDNENDEWD